MAIYNVNKTTGDITETAGKYGATSAEEVSYNNTASRLTATDVQGAVDEVADRTTWKFLGRIIGNPEINLPSDWKELLIQVNYNNTNINTLHLRGEQSESNNYINASFGNYGTSYAVGQVSKTKARLSTLNWAGQDVTNSAAVYYFYK